MANRILIDTNVLLDYLLEREPFFEDAKNVILSCAEGNIKGCIAVFSPSSICRFGINILFLGFSPSPV